jgi:hypothetical protein
MRISRISHGCSIAFDPIYGRSPACKIVCRGTVRSLARPLGQLLSRALERRRRGAAAFRDFVSAPVRARAHRVHCTRR